MCVCVLACAQIVCCIYVCLFLVRSKWLSQPGPFEESLMNSLQSCGQSLEDWKGQCSVLTQGLQRPGKGAGSGLGEDKSMERATCGTQPSPGTLQGGRRNKHLISSSPALRAPVWPPLA